MKLKTFAAATLTATLAVGGIAQADEYALQSAFPDLGVLGTAVNRFADRTREVSGGELDFRVYEAGKLAPPLEVLDSVGVGAIDAGWSYAGYWAGKAPAAPLFGSIPFGPDPIKFAAWLYAGGGLEIWRELYEPFNVVPTPCGLLVSEAGGWFNEPIESVEDFQGLNFRIGGLGGKVMAKLGAVPSSLPAGEVYVALETGKLDGTELGYPALDVTTGYQDIVENYYFPGWHQPGGGMELLINKDVWDGMTDGQRATIETVCQSNTAWSLSVGAIQQEAALEKIEEAGVNIRRFPDEVLDALRKATEEVIAEESGNDEMFRRAIESYQRFSATYDGYTELNRIGSGAPE